MKVQILNRIVGALVIALGTPVAFADSAAPAPQEVLAHYRTLYPNTEFSSVTETAVKGVYEVVMGRNIAYSDQDGKYFLFGHLFDMATQHDLTAERQLTIQRVAFSALPLDQAIVRVQGDGSRKLAVFSDPECPYCQALEPELLKLKDVTIYTFLMPLEQLHPDARAKADHVWCAPDKAAAWENLMLRGLSVPAEKCQSPVDANLKLASEYRISGTPTIVASDGRIKPGMARADALNEWLAAGGTVKSAHRTEVK